jgi:hypothetical protein
LNGRIIFSFCRIEKLRDVPHEDRKIEGLITDVFQMFPNVMVTILSRHTNTSTRTSPPRSTGNPQRNNPASLLA